MFYRLLSLSYIPLDVLAMVDFQIMIMWDTETV